MKSVRVKGSSPCFGSPTSLSSGSFGCASSGLSGGVDGGTMSNGMTGFVSAGCGICDRQDSHRGQRDGHRCDLHPRTPGKGRRRSEDERAGQGAEQRAA